MKPRAARGPANPVARLGLRRRALVIGGLLAFAPVHAGAAGAYSEIEWRGTRITVERSAQVRDLRRYRFRVARSDGVVQERSINESAARPRLRTGSAAFDGLFALTMREVDEDSVSSIQDAAFNGGRPIACRCFETGAKWHYVWTRDISYAADLGLALLDPERVRASLLFKTSVVRPELVARGVAPATVVAQDTGSGGSWPVSSDRVVWLHAALRAVDGLQAARGAEFARQLYATALDTLRQEREFAFDAASGLYRGETSFLDWREQNYPAATARDTRFIAESFALSTNVLHYVALQDATFLARHVPGADATGLEQQALELRAAIDRAFWLEDVGLYASYLAPGLRPQPVRSFDLLGESLAVVHGIADRERARRIVRGYPRTEAGAPVVFPARPGIPIYHNRAIWPFVSAYALRAAARVREPDLAAEHLRSLLRGAASALSNMENFEFLTLQPAVDDGAMSGPVINSPRQLWSVAALAGTVLEVLWGIAPQRDAIQFAPFMPAATAAELAGRNRTLRLRGLRHRGYLLDVSLQLPKELPPGAWLEAGEIRANGEDSTDGRVPLARLRRAAANRIEIALRVGGTSEPPPPPLAVRDPRAPDAEERSRLFAPASPAPPTGTRSGGFVRLTLPPIDPGLQLEAFRDGTALGVVGGGLTYDDQLPERRATACYSLRVRRADLMLESLPSPEVCLPAAEFSETIDAGDPRIAARGARLGADGEGRAAYGDWGTPEQRIELDFTARASGLERLRLEYQNRHGPINTGITAAVKRVSVRCAPDEEPQRGVIVMPHSAPQGEVALSTAFLFRVREGVSCHLVLSDGFNMSYLAHFALYTGGEGGASGPLNAASLQAFRFEFVGSEPPHD